LSRRIDTADGPWWDVDALFADAISCHWEQTITWSETMRPYAAGDLLPGVGTRIRTLQASGDIAAGVWTLLMRWTWSRRGSPVEIPH
jgi:hypothetical protein